MRPHPKKIDSIGKYFLENSKPFKSISHKWFRVVVQKLAFQVPAAAFSLKLVALLRYTMTATSDETLIYQFLVFSFFFNRRTNRKNVGRNQQFQGSSREIVLQLFKPHDI